MQIFMLRKIRTTQPEMFSLWRKENSVLKYIRIIVLPSQDNNVIFSFSEIDEVFFFRPIATNGHLTQLRYNKVSQSVGRAGMRHEWAVWTSSVTAWISSVASVWTSSVAVLQVSLSPRATWEWGPLLDQPSSTSCSLWGCAGCLQEWWVFLFWKKRRIHSRTLIYYSASYHSCELYTGVLCNCSVLNLVRNAKTVRFPITLWGNSSQNAKHIFFCQWKFNVEFK